jgi:rubrerythrin
MEQTQDALQPRQPAETTAAQPEAEPDLEALDDSGGASVVLVEYDATMNRPRAFHALPDWLATRVSRSDILAANPHEGVALYCRTCDLLLNGARTGGVCPICGESDRERVLYLLAEPDGD